MTNVSSFLLNIQSALIVYSVLALLIRNPKLKRELIALNVVYDDADVATNQAKGKRLLEKLSRDAAASEVPVTTQVRVAVNIANGIKTCLPRIQCQ